MSEKIKILGFAGSLRKGSYNKMLLRAALELLPAEAELEIFDQKVSGTVAGESDQLDPQAEGGTQVGAGT